VTGRCAAAVIHGSRHLLSAMVARGMGGDRGGARSLPSLVPPIATSSHAPVPCALMFMVIATIYLSVSPRLHPKPVAA